MTLDFREYDTRLAAYAVLVDTQDRILLTWYNGEGVNTPEWSLPGGGVEYEESLEEAVVREVYEETGLRVEAGLPLLTHHFVAPGKLPPHRPYKSLRVLFSATILGGELGTTEVDGSTDHAEWIPIAELDQRGRRAGIVDLALGLVREGRAERVDLG